MVGIAALLAVAVFAAALLLLQKGTEDIEVLPPKPRQNASETQRINAYIRGNPVVAFQGGREGKNEERAEQENQRTGPVFRGIVLDPGGTPIAGARIQVRNRLSYIPLMEIFSLDDPPEASHMSLAAIMSATTPGVTYAELQSDAQGRFDVFATKDMGKQSALIVTSAGQGAAFLFCQSNTKTPPSKPVEIQLPLAAPISGRIIDSEGFGVFPATVLLLREVFSSFGREHWFDRLETQTDDAGAFRFEHAEPGDWVVAAYAKGRAPVTHGPITAPAQTVELLLEPGFTLRGTVCTANSGELIAKTTLSLFTRGKWLYDLTKTDDQGRFSFPNLLRGQTRLRIKREGYATKEIFIPLTKLECGIVDLDLPLHRALQIKGTLVCGRTGHGLHMGHLEWNEDYGSLGFSRFSIDENGCFSLLVTPPIGRCNADTGELLRDWNLVLTAYAEDYESVCTEVQIPAGAQCVTGVRIKLLPWGGIRGRTTDMQGRPVQASVELFPAMVRRPGDPWKGVLYSFHQGMATADAEGRFAIGGVGPNTPFVLVATLGKAKTWTPRLMLSPDGTHEDVELTISKGGSIRATVTDDSGKGLHFGGIFFTPEDKDLGAGSWSGRIVRIQENSLGNGIFEAHHLKPGIWRMETYASPFFYFFDRKPDPAYVLIKECLITVREGEVTQIHAKAVPALSIEGLVTNTKGEPLSSVEVFASSLIGTHKVVKNTNDNGRFRFPRLPPGCHELHFHRLYLKPVHMPSVQAGSKDLVVVMEAD
jgi:protocatechuate 3,4-dioxygenase beta subunit